MDEVIELLNQAQAKIISVGMSPDFDDLRYGDVFSRHLPDTQEDASRLISKAVKMLTDFSVNKTV